MYSDSARLTLRCLFGCVQRFLSPGRSRHSIKLIIFTAFFVCPHISTRAQDEVVKVRTDLVLVPIRVSDRSRKPITNLRREDFELLVDGQPIKPDFFSTGSPSVNLLFLLDQSGSVRDTIARQTD